MLYHCFTEATVRYFPGASPSISIHLFGIYIYSHSISFVIMWFAEKYRNLPLPVSVSSYDKGASIKIAVELLLEIR